MPLLTIENSSDQAAIGEVGGDGAHTIEWCRRLESGDILYFPCSPIPLSAADLEFLLSRQQSGSSLHKNIAWKPGRGGQAGLISGIDRKAADPAACERLHSIMFRYSAAVEEFLRRFLQPYRGRWRLDYASYRPQEEQGRDLPLRRRNDLLHTDAFPTRPTRGRRILRFFNNIHPSRTRDWVVSDPFGEFVGKYAPGQIALPKADGVLRRALREAGLAAGLGRAIPSLKRTPYDAFMMRWHNFLKENTRFQEECRKYPLQFPSGSSWMVYTDMVPHAVLSGQYALEQTFLIEPAALVWPQNSPLAVLEEMTKSRLT